MSNSRWTKGRLLACAAVAGLAAITACTSGSSDSDDAANHAVGSTGDDAAIAERTEASADDIAATEFLDDRKLIKTGTIEVESDDVDKLLGQLEGVVTLHQGLVDSEDVRTDDDGDARSATIVVRVPVDRFEAAVDDIAGLGELVRVQTSSEDVTTRVADVDARVASAQRAIAQLQVLFDRAAQLRDVIRLESELARRQADLESLQAQQSALARQTALSTIHVSITRTDEEQATDGGDEAGFVDGLESGWSALVTFVRGIVHVFGLVLPIGSLLVALAAAAWLLFRRLRPSTPRGSAG
ncbi:MAG TPA: DUF4349 domain-containing protein [Nocardioidaceae bacterium]|nr:DUF4349 domain-containing protein [Nocardioidaceae bacterium]